MRSKRDKPYGFLSLVTAKNPFHGCFDIVVVMWRAALCVRGAQSFCQQASILSIVEHNRHSESSHFNRSGSLRHPAAERYAAEVSTGGRHAATAACLVRNVISA